MHTQLTETLSKYDTIILVGGGTGGHIQPILNLLSIGGDIREANDGGLVRKFLWVGGESSNEQKEAENSGIEFKSISTLKLSTTLSPKVLLYPFMLIRGIWEARKILCHVIARNEAIHVSEEKSTGSLHTSRGRNQLTTKPANQQICVFSKGGPGSVAVGIAAWSLGIPLYIHESDTIPGRSNRILGKIATKIFLGFESAKKYFDERKCEVVGQILHPIFSSGILNLESGIVKWKTDRPHILVICGSQGARAIFEEILKNLEEILRNHEVILVLGKLNIDMRSSFEEKLGILNLESGILNLIDWISQEDLAHLIQGADIAITRGSATTLAELTAFRSYDPMILGSHDPKLIIIPLPYAADNHQYWNAKEYEKMGDILLEQKNIGRLNETIKNLGQNSKLSNT